MTQTFDARKDRTALRLRLLANGFSPLPNKNKMCLLPGWPQIEATPEIIQSKEWARRADWKDTGIRCGKVVALDFDIDNPELLNGFLDAVVEEGLIEESPFVRVGRAPREMWIYRSNAPIAKRTSGGFGNDTIEKAQVEVLGVGNQFGAFGQHSDEIAYTWPVKSIADHDVTELPEITPAQIEKLIERAAAYFEGQGLTRLDLGGAGGLDGSYTRVFDLTRDMVFPTRELGNVTVAQLEDYLLENPSTVLRCTVEALRPSTGGSMAGMASLIHGAVCISDHGSYTAHFRSDLNPSGRMASIADKLAARLKIDLTLPDAAPPPPVDLDMNPRDGFDDNLAIALERFVYVSADDTVLDLMLNTPPYAIKHFRNLMMPYLKVEEGERGADHVTRLVDAWLQNPDRRDVATVQMRPDHKYPLYEVDGVLHANTYRPHILPTHGNPDMGIAFLEQLVPEPQERRYLLQWLGYKLRYPGTRGPAIVMVADATYGTGRGSLVALLTDMFHERYVTSIDFATLTGKTYQSQYKEWMVDSLLITVNEASEGSGVASKWDVKNDAYEYLKTIVDPAVTRLQLNRKGVANTQAWSFASIMVMTNHADALVIPANDRRFYVIENGQGHPTEYWLKFHEWRANPANVGAFREYLLSIDLAGYSPFAEPPQTRAKDEMVYAGTSELDRAMYAVLNGLPGRLVTAAQVMLRLEDYLADNSVTFPQEWKRIAERLLLKMTRKPDRASTDRVRLEGRQHVVRALPRLNPEILKSSESMLEEVLKNGPAARHVSTGGARVIPLRKALGGNSNDNSAGTAVGS